MMRNQRIIASLVLTMLAGLLSAAAIADTAQKGSYVLRIEGLSRYGTDFIRILDAGEREVAGEVGIDWGIGPQARAPQEWEKLYREPFKAKIINEGRAFRFIVTIAGRRRYDFTLFPARDRRYRPVLVGTVTITSKNKKEGFRDGTYGVLAEPPENRE